jgi:hypothetical protein
VSSARPFPDQASWWRIVFVPRDSHPDSVGRYKSRSISARGPLPRDRGSLRYSHGMPHNRPREFLCRNRLCKQKALDQIESHLAHRQKIRSRLDPFSDSTCAIGIGEVKDLPHIAFQPIVRTTGNELPIDFDFDEKKVAQTDERRPFCSRSSIAIAKLWTRPNGSFRRSPRSGSGRGHCAV